jgi:hypothetical protein
MDQTLTSAAPPPPARGFDLRSRLCAAGVRHALRALVDIGTGEVVGYAPFDGF